MSSLDDGDRYDFCPWLFWAEASEEHRASQLALQEALRATGLRSIGDRSFVSRLAAIHQAELAVGAESYIAAHVYLTGDVALGDNTTLNPYATVRGTVRLGDGVRVGAHTSLLGFNHSIDPSAPVYRQPITSLGITVQDDVWIGSQVVVLDGVTIGAHSVIGAGAVVTKDVPEWSIMAGNPARRLRDRREPSARGGGARSGDGLTRSTDDLARFAGRARDQAAAVLDRYRRDGPQPWFVNQPGAPATVRAGCDAVEIADLLLGGAPPGLPGTELADRLAGWQDPATGLVPEIGAAPPAADQVPGPGRWPLDDGQTRYHILAVGYALDLLGSSFRHPVHAVAGLGADALTSTLDSLPWTDQAWSCGDWVDAYATGLYWNRATFGLDGHLATLIGWLHLRQDRWTGLWGSPAVAEGRRQPVNGYYRLTRGAFAQFGSAVPNPESTIDSVLAHSRDARFFADGRGTACDVLDVVHPLWLCGQQTGYRRDEARRWARQRLAMAVTGWRPAAGFAFDPGPGRGAPHEPSLMGTEMWLAIVWLLADVLGESDALGFRPRGVHAPGPRPLSGRVEDLRRVPRSDSGIGP